ncbi:MAG: pilus assembly protein [Acidobacteriia bacterium]|nr:pilus assembly protein [Terriglobia bacterium]
MRIAGRRQRSRGSVLVELTLSATFLVALFLGVWQFGYGFYIYSQLEQAVRDGARYASLRTYNSANSTPTADFTTAVQNVVVYGDPAPANGATPIAPGLTTANVSVTVTFTSVPTAINVAITNYKLPTYYGNQTLSGKPTTSFPFVGVFGPP